MALPFYSTCQYLYSRNETFTIDNYAPLDYNGIWKIPDSGLSDYVNPKAENTAF